MRTLKIIFSVATIIFALVGLFKILPYTTTMPIMFFFLGLSMLANAKECYDKGMKKDAKIFLGVAIYLYAVTAINLISRFINQ